MKFTKNVKLYDGSVLAFTFPALCIPIETDEPKAELRRIGDAENAIAKLLSRRAQSKLQRRIAADPLQLTSHIEGLITAFELDAELPSIGHKVFQLPAQGGSERTSKSLLFIETIDPRFTVASLNFIAKACNDSPLPLDDEFSALIASVCSFARRTNHKYLVSALKTLDVPATAMPGDMLLCGWGERSRFLNSSSTERTGAACVNLAKDKAAATLFLAQCGLPIAEQQVVTTFEGAREASAAIGYPVVVKPRSRDGGIGVTREVRNDDQLRVAFDFASAEDANVLVQRQAEGSEFRILIAADELIGMHERLPAIVVGDGVHRVIELVEAENARRGRKEQTGFADFLIPFESDAERCLAACGMSRNSVPAAGVAVRLSTVPKVRNGGSIRVVLPNEVHSTVVDAARRAVRMFRLDVGGVDYISTDCSRPVSETGGIITEVNAFPQINPFDDFDIYARFLSVLMPGVGRLPSVLVPGGEGEIPLVTSLVNRAAAAGLVPGVIVENAAISAALNTAGIPAAPFGNRLSVLADERINCLIAVQSSADMVRRGLFLPSFDAVYLGARGGAEDAARNLGGPLLRQSIRGPALTLSGHRDGEGLGRTFKSHGVQYFANSAECQKAACEILAKHPV